MAIHHYDYMIVANPPASRNEGSQESVGYHVRPLPASTVSTDELTEYMHQLEPSLTRGTCIAAVGALARALGELMADGHAVDIKGIGTLRPRLSGVVTEEARGLAAHNVCVSGTTFTPDEELLQLANEGRPTLCRRGVGTMPDDDVLQSFLQEHFAKYDRLTRKVLVEHFGITRDQAVKLLHQLVDEGCLVARGSRATAHYVKG